ncbi:hypothetical protein F2Q69_00058445 [Brassica cretica]|uniref:Uncharacterized protein n=1 Tax=Brassica cretica TaxID=69181 RepID=A0A8S9RQX6_BRACR|nr:hypothetical protein F2Q69_00058445 [Brassica cretica]
MIKSLILRANSKERKNTPNHRSYPHPTVAPLRDLCHHPRSPQSCLLQSHRRFLPPLLLDRARPYAFSGVSSTTAEETSMASVSNSVEHSSPAVTAAQGLRTTEDASIEASSKLLESPYVSEQGLRTMNSGKIS